MKLAPGEPIDRSARFSQLLDEYRAQQLHVARLDKKRLLCLRTMVRFAESSGYKLEGIRIFIDQVSEASGRLQQGRVALDAVAGSIQLELKKAFGLSPNHNFEWPAGRWTYRSRATRKYVKPPHTAPEV